MQDRTINKLRDLKHKLEYNIIYMNASSIKESGTGEIFSFWEMWEDAII